MDIRTQYLFSMLLCIVLFGCDEDGPPRDTQKIYRFQIRAGNQQTGEVNQVLADAIQVRVAQENGDPIFNFPVHFEVSNGGGAVIQKKLRTNSLGIANTFWQLGVVEGEQSLKVYPDTLISILEPDTLFFEANAVRDQFDCGEDILDKRDAKAYKTKAYVGLKCWLGENVKWDSPNARYYNDESSLGDSLGYLYTYAAALESCPEGWHLPSDAEWKLLLDFAGQTSDDLLVGGELEFEVPMGGFYNAQEGQYEGKGAFTYYWTNESNLYVRLDTSGRAEVILSAGSPGPADAMYLRCLTNN